MTMTNEEICRDYRNAKVPTKQIKILAELNQCTMDDIKRILTEGGEKLPGNMMPKPKKEPAPKPEPEKPTRPPMEREPVDMRAKLAAAAVSVMQIRLVDTMMDDGNMAAYWSFVRGVVTLWNEMEGKL